MAEAAPKTSTGRFALLEPGKVPAKGQRSAVSPTQLGAGYWARMQNWRFDNLNLQVRNGIKALVAAGPVGGSVLRGAWHGFLNNVETFAGAYDVAGAVRLYTVNIGTQVWTEITASSGAYGNTRMTTGKLVSFACIKEPFNGTECLLAVNGTDPNRLWTPGGSVVPIQAVTLNAPSASSCQLSLYTTGYNYQGYNHAGYTITNSGGNFTLAAGAGIYGAGGSQITVAAAVADGDTIKIDWPGGHSAAAFNDLQQLLVFLDGAQDPWNSIQVEVGTGGTFYTLWDPRTGVNGPQFLAPFDSAQALSYVAIFETVVGNLPGAGAITQIRFTWRGAAPAAGFTMELLGVIPTGGFFNSLNFQGGSTFAYSLYNSGSKQESPNWVISNYILPFGSAIVGTPVNWSLPNSPLIWFNATLNVPLPNATDIGRGVDSVVYYYLAEGSTTWAFLNWAVELVYAGSWPTGLAGQIIAVGLGGAAFANPGIPKPDAYLQPIPIGSAVLVSGKRLYVVGCGTTKSQCWVSWYGAMTRFESQVAYLAVGEPDPNSATIVETPGEVMMGIAKIPGRFIGVDPISIWTQQGNFRLNGTSSSTLSIITRMNSRGLLYPRAYTEHMGILYWLDQELQVISLVAGQPVPICKKKIDDRIRASTLTTASMGTFNDRVYLACQAPGSASNVNLFVYETLYKEWCEDKLAAGDAGQLLTIDGGSSRVLYAFSSSGPIYQLESPGQVDDAGAAIPTLLIARHAHTGFVRRAQFGPVTVAMDPANATMTITRTYGGQDADSLGVDGTINLALPLAAPVNNLAWLEEIDTVNQAAIGGSAAACQVSLSANLPAGTQMYAAWMNITDTGLEGAHLGG